MTSVLPSGIVGIAVIPTMLRMLSNLRMATHGLWIVLLAVHLLLGEVDFGLSLERG